jgi:MraZ protein
MALKGVKCRCGKVCGKFCKKVEENGKYFLTLSPSVKVDSLTSMVRFFGKATGKVDDKGRLVFPSIFRDAMIRGCAEDMTLVVKKNVHQRCLDLFPYEEWVRRSDKVLENRDPELNIEDAEFWTKYNDGVFTLVPDGKLGRLNIPSELLESAGITKEVVFGGVGYKLQIWDAETMKADLLSDEKFKETASRLSVRK